MGGTLLRAYHALPPWAQSLAATARGYYLRRWRYGPETERYVEETLARDYWSPEKLKSWQEERLQKILHGAATRVPFYRQHWQERRRRGDRASWDVLSNWPILEKESVRKYGTMLLADDNNFGPMFRDVTSGTTGKPLEIWIPEESLRLWYAVFEARCRRWYGVSRHDRWAILGGQLVTPVTRQKPPFWVWNHGLRQLYMSSYHLAPRFLPAYLEALKQYQVTYLLGYTSSLYMLAQSALETGCRHLPLKVVVANAEPVYRYQRELIERAFGCPLRESYGMAEAVAAASECEHGTLHLWPTVGYVEILENGTQVAPGESGELVCTGLLNTEMPLIRYRVGDRAVAGSDIPACPCGRGLPTLGGIEGRCDDVLYTPDGRTIGRLDPVFKAHVPVREAQLVQETLDVIRVRYIPDPEFRPEHAETIASAIRERMGDVQVVMDPVQEIERTKNGKMRFVVCNLSDRERRQVTGGAVVGNEAP